MNKNASPKPKKIIWITAASLIVLLCGYLGLRIYIVQDLTWNDLYSFFSIETSGKLEVDGEVSVAVLDVGQGDCIVIQAGETTVMIDAGDRGAEQGICAFLDDNGIKRIDYLLATHPHADHIGGMRGVIEHCEIGEVLFSHIPDAIVPTTSVYRGLLEIIAARQIPSHIADVGEKITLDRGLLTVLFAGGLNDLNNCSLVVRYDYGAASFLFMGDAELKVEDDLMSRDAFLSADVLKAGHHGSQTGTSELFLEAVAPSFVVASAGTGNTYGHPHRAFMDRVAAYGAVLLRTDLGGSIIFVCDGGEPVYQQPAGKAA